MATYPTIAQGTASRETAQDGIAMLRMTNGKARGVAEWDRPRRRLEVVHPGITSPEADELLNHYASHGGAAFDFTWAATGETLECRYSDALKRQAAGKRASDGALLWTVTNTIEET